MGRRKFSEELKEMRRAEIIEAAQKVFAEQGYERASVADICAEAGIAHGTFYYYFKNKLSVLEGVLEKFYNIFNMFHKTWDIESINVPGEATDFIEKGWAVIGEFFVENIDITKIFFQESYRSGEVANTRIKSFYETVSQNIVSHLEYGIEVGILHPCDPEVTAEMIIGAVERAFYRFAIGEVDEPFDVYFEKIGLFLIRALVKSDYWPREPRQS